MEVIEDCFHVVLSNIILHKVDPIVKSADVTQVCDYSSESH